MALFNKDWNTYKRNWQNANGIGGKIGSLFTPANAITKTDIDAIKAYNAQIDSCVTSQTAFNRTMLNASPAAQNLVASYNGGKVSAQGMATAQNMAKTSTIGLTIAQTALNAAIGMGVGLLINLVVQGVNKLIHANEEAIESAKKLREEYEEFKSTNASNVSTLKGLEDEFKKLSKGVSQYGDNISLTTEQYERYKEIVQQIVGMSPSLAEGYSTENGYIADKNGLLERAIELQEIEYRNELRKITNLENLKTSMSGYIAEYKDVLNGGIITAEENIVATTTDTDFKNSLWQLFNTNNRENYDGQSMAKDIMEALGIQDIDAEMQKYFNEHGYWQDSWFWNDYCDTIIENLDAVTNSISFEEVGLDESVFDQNLEKLKSYAESYSDMKDSVQMANEAIQTDLGYIAEYADGYSELSTEQQKFVSDFLKGFDISDISSENAMGFLEYDNDKMASVKSQIKKFIEELSQDETTKEALADLYAIPTDEQSIGEFVEQFRSALDIIKAYCEENGIEIPIAITNSKKAINELEAQQQRAVDFVKDKFDGYDPTAFFKENSINTKEEVDKWLEIAQAANSAADAEERYVQGSTSDDETTVLSTSQITEKLNSLQDPLDKLKNVYEMISTGKMVDISSIEEIRKSFSELGVDTAKLETYLTRIGRATNLDEAQSSINLLATELLRTSGIVEGVSSENKEFAANMLELMGFTEAEAILIRGLADEELYLAKNTALSTTEAVEKLKTLEDSLSSLQEAYLMLQDGEEIDLSSLDGIRASFEELEGIDMNVINEALDNIANAKTIDEAQDSMNALATEYLYSSDILKGLNSENADLIENKLRLMGFIESEEIVTRGLTAQQEYLAEQKRNSALESDNLTNATYEEINAFIASGNASESTRQHIIQLMLAKIDLNATKIDEKTNVDALIAIANAAGATQSRIVSLRNTLANIHNAPETAQKAFYENYKEEFGLNPEDFYVDYKAPATSGGGGSGGNKTEEKDTIEVIDFLEIKIQRLTDLYDNFKDKASKTFQNLTKRTNLYSEALERNAELLELNETAYKYYENYANSIGLSEEYVQQVRDGSINIEEFKNDEELTKKINDYQQWYEKAVECQEALETLREEQRQLVQDSVEMVITKYDQLLDKYESKKEKISKKLDLSESFGFFAKPASYNKINTYIQKQVGLYEKQIGKLKELKKTVDYGSEAWREYQARINDANASIKDLTVSIVENAYSASEISKQRADKKVETLDSKDEMTDAKIGNSLGYIRKNNLINTKSNRIDKRQTQYDKAVTRSTNSLKKTKNKINKVKNKSGDKKYSTVLKNVKSRIKSGKRIGEQLLNKVANLDDNLALFNLCSQYNAYFDARKENKEIANIFEQTAKQQKADLALEKLSNIELKYGYGISANDRNKNNLNNQMALAEEQGKRISTAYYDGMIVSEKSNIAILEKQRKAMQISLNKSVKNGDIEMNSDEWFEAVESINSVTEAIEQGTITIQEYVNAQRQIRWDAFDDALETIQRINSESDYFIERLSNKKLFNEKGEFEDSGNATMALHGVNYKNNLSQAQEYLDEYNRILASGDTSQQAIDRMRQLQDAYWSCQQATEGNLDSVKSLISEGYDKQLDYIGKMIEQYKKLRDSEREAYEYSKQISKKTKNISDLRKQMTALGANDTEESKAKLQQIKLQLESENESLKETQYDKFINDSNRMLDDMMNDYELYIDEKLENIYGELPKIVDGIMGQGGIVETLKTIDANLSTTLQGVITGTVDTKKNASTEVNTLQKQATAPITNPTPAPYSVEQNTNESLLKALEKSEKKNADLKKEELYNKAMDFIDKKASKTTKKRSELKAINKRIHKLTDGMILGTNELKELANILGVKHNGHGENSNLYKKLKEIGIKGFATGSKYIPKDQLAWTQEKGQEVIYSKLTGHMLTPLGKGDKVFTAEMTDKLWEFSRNGIVADSPMREFASKIPDSVNNIQHNTVGDVNVNIGDVTLPNVTNSVEFANSVEQVVRDAMCSGGKTQKCITESVASSIGGKGTGSSGLWRR